MRWRPFKEHRRTRWAPAGREARPESIMRLSVRNSAGEKEWNQRLIVAAVVLSTVAACGILVWVTTQSLGRLLFWQNDLFRIRDIKIECNGDIITPKLIMEHARLSDMTCLFATNIESMRGELIEEPRIKTVEVKRRLPGELFIRVRERMSMAQLEIDNYYLTLDRDGYVLGPVRGLKVLPIIRGYILPGIRPGVQLSATGVRNALEVLDVCQSTPIGQRLSIASIDVRNPQSLDIRLADGERVLLAWDHMGEPTSLARQQLEQKLARLSESLKSAAHRNKRIAWIDMTLEKNFPAQEY